MIILDTPGQLIDKLSIVNIKLWMAEDRIRDCNYELVETAKQKQRIDQLNSQRNKLIQKIDEVIKEGNWEPLPQLKDYGRETGQD